MTKIISISIVLIVWLCLILNKQGKTAKKQHLEKKEYAMQYLVSSGFSGCEFRMYYPPTNNQIYICKVRARSFRLVFCEPK